MTEITIPDSVASIGEMAFFDCKDLEKVYCSAGSAADDIAVYTSVSSAEPCLIYKENKAVKSSDGTVYFITGINGKETELSGYTCCELYSGDKAISKEYTVYEGFIIGGVEFSASEMDYDYIVGYKITNDTEDITALKDSYLIPA